MDLFLILASAQAAAETTPQLTGLSVQSIEAGACSGDTASPSAKIRVGWSSSNFDPAVHTYKLYENGVLKTSTTDITWEKTFSGNIENGPYQLWKSNLLYRVDIAKAANGQVLSSMTAPLWAQWYGTCRDPGQPE